jgi:hypothetical protein
MAIHKGSELNNIRETWDQNEKLRQRGEAASASDDATGVNPDLLQTIREEAAAYDRADKEERLLGGDRATVSDDNNDTADD